MDSMPKVGDPPSTVIALLGRQDAPTDALWDYCRCLARALERRGVPLEVAEVAWESRGWLRALLGLWRESKEWRGKWVLVQYTALSWSLRGFSYGVLAALWVLRRRQVRCAIVFHDANAYPGNRLVDRLRRACQCWVMRTAYHLAARCTFPVPREGVSWLPASPNKAVFIPVGANLPVSLNGVHQLNKPPRSLKTVAVFGVTGGSEMLHEVRDIAYAVNRAKTEVPHLGLVVLGRGSREASEALEQALHGTEVEVSVLGLLPAEEVAQRLVSADVLLFVRGQISSRRGSAIAGLACGLPIVGYAGSETGFPITEAGVELVAQGNREGLAEALARVLADEGLRKELQQRSLRAQVDHFSWDVIADRYAEVLRDG